MTLKSLLVVDPVESVARHIADQCERLATERRITLDGRSALEQALAHAPEMIILSLETRNPEALELTHTLRQKMPEVFILATFRELSVPSMEKLGKLGIDDFIAQPLDFAAVFRAASRHFGVPFRRHDRHAVALDITRLDGVVIGRTRDLSLGGMLFDAFHPINPDESVLVDLGVPGKPIRVRCHILAVEGQAPMSVQARGEFDKLRGTEQKRLVDYLATVAKNNPASRT